MFVLFTKRQIFKIHSYTISNSQKIPDVVKLNQDNLFDKQLLPRLREKKLHNHLCDNERQLITVQHYYSTGQFATECIVKVFCCLQEMKRPKHC